MKKVVLTAIKQCGKASPGKTFHENTAIAKALVALGRAEYAVEKKPVDLFGDVPSADEDSGQATRGADGLLISDAVREYAQLNGIDVTALIGTGKDGRINKKDIETAMEKKAAASSSGNQPNA